MSELEAHLHAAAGGRCFRRSSEAAGASKRCSSSALRLAADRGVSGAVAVEQAMI